MTKDEARRDIEAVLLEEFAGKVLQTGEGRGDANTFTKEDLVRACMEWLASPRCERN